jgi:dephospho-CoA kinase
MLDIALTGSRFSGKNSVSFYFKKMNIPIFDADIVLKYILNFNKDVIKKSNFFLESTFQHQTFINPFSISNDSDFDKILDIALPYLNDVYKRFREDNRGKPYTIFMSSLIFYRDIRKFDKIINIYSPYDIRCSRVELDDIWIIDAEKRDDIKFNNKSDYVIHNYDDLEILPQILNIDNKIVDHYLGVSCV